jgi:dihydroorotate dehydrogenase
MKLRGIEFGNILGASGVQGFFGEGYWFHQLSEMLGMDFTGMTFVSKTATLWAREGNMPLTEKYTPREYFPDCVKVKIWRGLMLNSVGLSNPGLKALLKTGQWQQRKEPFWISIMSAAETRWQRMQEFIKIVDIIGNSKDSFSTPFGLQINLSCPNTGHDPKNMISESADVLDLAGGLEIPLMLKYSIATAPIKTIMELERHPDCDAICVSNTLPFGWEKLDWQKVWGSKTSPLEKFEYGKGGLSGSVLRPLVCQWIREIREAGFTKPINGGGGILSAKDVKLYHQAGASSVFLGSAAALRPLNVNSIIDQANNLNWE